ncbi:Threonine dehydratase biosynthetic [Abeliophyllum distichum]|uniref:Threonine dehydratase biosynthetic n=1 Tax=Abeliophyllum distichum TaxID=126358 RepID=A0ABD1RFU5_9LAMI
MEALCFVPAQSPLLRSTFSTNATVKTPSTSVKSNRVKPFIEATISKPTGDILPAVDKSLPAPLLAPPPLLRVSPSSLQCDSGCTTWRTNLHCSWRQSSRIGGGVNVWLKREDLQPVFSFKLRGAYNMMAKLPREQLERGVICSSAGNHAQGVALSAHRLGCNAVIAMPVTTPEIKWKSVKSLGATVVLVGDSYDEAQAYAKKTG